MTTRNRKPVKETSTAPPAADGKVKAGKTRKESDPNRRTKQQPLQKRERKSPGRKPWIPDLEQIENWARMGLKDTQIAGLCGVRKETFSARKNEFSEQKIESSELAEALARGRAKGVSMASIALWKNIAKGDQRAIEFYLERIGGWKKAQVIEKGQSVEDLTDEELLARLEELLAGTESSKSCE